MTKDELIGSMARMTRYSFDQDDDGLEDAIATLNRLIGEAKEIRAKEQSDQLRSWGINR